jgi:hypothetical protein
VITGCEPVSLGDACLFDLPDGVLGVEARALGLRRRAFGGILRLFKLRNFDVGGRKVGFQRFDGRVDLG